jgi:hypothetical protein
LKRIAALLAAAALHRDDADDVVGEPGAQAARIEIVHRRDGAELGQEPERHQRHQRERIEIGIVIAGEHRRPVARQSLAMAHREPERDEDDRAHHDREKQEPEQPGEGVPAHG